MVMIFFNKKLTVSIIFLLLIALVSSTGAQEDRRLLFGDRNNRSFISVAFPEVPDKTLQELLDKMLSHNNSLKMMIATINRVRSEYAITRSAMSPKLDFFVSAGHSKGRDENSINNNDYLLSVPVSYEIDISKRLSHLTESAYLEMEAAVYERKALSMTLVAELMERYYTGLFLLEQLKSIDEVITYTEKLGELVNHQYKSGLASKIDVISVEQAKKTLIANRTIFTETLPRIEHALSILAGEQPRNGWLKGAFSVPYWLEKEPAKPLDDYVQQRPDIQNLRLRFVSSIYKASAARSASKPALYLTGNADSGANEINKFMGDNKFGWGIFAKMQVPIFDGKRNQSEYDAKLYASDELDKEYHELLLTARVEAVNAMSSGIKQEEIVKIINTRNNLMAEEFEIIKQRHDAGMGDLLSVIREKQNLVLARMEFNRHQLQFISFRIQLVRALGNGWWPPYLTKE